MWKHGVPLAHRILAAIFSMACSALRFYKDNMSLGLALKKPIWTDLNEESPHRAARGRRQGEIPLRHHLLGHVLSESHAHPGRLHLPPDLPAGLRGRRRACGPTRRRRVKKDLDADTLPFLAAYTALSFVLMMVALPLPGGTTVHAAGIGLLAVSFGGWMAFLAISLVLAMQALLFGDGGVTALPINALAMGLAGSFAALAAWKLLGRLQRERRPVPGRLALHRPARRAGGPGPRHSAGHRPRPAGARPCSSPSA
jgi:hypothetical protein